MGIYTCKTSLKIRESGKNRLIIRPDIFIYALSTTFLNIYRKLILSEYQLTRSRLSRFKQEIQHLYHRYQLSLENRFINKILEYKIYIYTVSFRDQEMQLNYSRTIAKNMNFYLDNSNHKSKEKISWPSENKCCQNIHRFLRKC